MDAKTLKRRRVAVENGKVFPVPGLTRMTKKQMAKIIQAIWTHCDEMEVPTHNAGVEMSLYGRVYTGFRMKR